MKANQLGNGCCRCCCDWPNDVAVSSVAWGWKVVGSCYVPRLSQSRPKPKNGDFLGRQADHRDISRLRVSLPSHEACGLPALNSAGSNRPVSLTPHNSWKQSQVHIGYTRNGWHLGEQILSLSWEVIPASFSSQAFLHKWLPSECALFAEVSLSPLSALFNWPC